MAIGWTKGAEKQIDQIRRTRVAREVRDKDHALEIKAALESLDVQLGAHAGDGGRLFGSVTSGDVAAAVRKAGGPLLDKRNLSMAAHVKTVGPRKVEARLHPEETAAVTSRVVAGGRWHGVGP